MPSAVLQALYAGSRAEVDRLLAEDPELDVFDAAALGLTYRLTVLVREDPSLVHAYSDDGFTALHLAAFFGGPVAVDYLLQAGADPNQYDLCPYHAEALTVPIGWARSDRRRTNVRPLFERVAV